MTHSMQLTKHDVRRAMVRHHFTLCANQTEAFEKLRSVQFDPIAPVGCNHDLVLQARVPGYQVGDWRKIAYDDRLVYDGWDKMASLVPFAGWPLRRYIYTVHRRWFEKTIFEDLKEAVQLILKEIADRGPLMPKECEFQQRREEWKGSWFGPSVTKQVLRALWHSGAIMTAGRKSGQHIYDLTERVVPSRLFHQPLLEAKDAVRELVLECYDKGLKTLEIARRFNVSRSWARRVKQRWQERKVRCFTQQKHGRHRKLTGPDREALAALVQATPDATLHELHKQMNKPVSVGTVCRALIDIKLTLKKVPARGRTGPPRCRDPARGLGG